MKISERTVESKVKGGGILVRPRQPKVVEAQAPNVADTSPVEVADEEQPQE